MPVSPGQSSNRWAPASVINLVRCRYHLDRLQTDELLQMSLTLSDAGITWTDFEPMSSCKCHGPCQMPACSRLHKLSNYSTNVCELRAFLFQGRSSSVCLRYAITSFVLQYKILRAVKRSVFRFQPTANAVYLFTSFMLWFQAALCTM